MTTVRIKKTECRCSAPAVEPARLHLAVDGSEPKQVRRSDHVGRNHVCKPVMSKIDTTWSDHRNQSNQEGGDDAAKVCRPHQALEEKGQESVYTSVDQDVPAGEGRATERGRDNAHEFWCRPRAPHGAFDSRRDAAGAPAQELEHGLDRKSESEPE